MDARRKEPLEQIRSVDDQYEHAEKAFSDTEKAFSDPQWAPGFIARFPWLGFGALFTALLCSAASIVTLLVSNGKSQTDWPQRLAPNVILSGLNSIVNICFGIAIGNGIAIAWWRKTLKGATIDDLHRSWAFSSSFKDLVFSGKYFNFIALAALTTKLTIIDSMLLQRATTTVIAVDHPIRVTNIYGWSNDTIPITGRVQGRTPTPGLLNTTLNDNLITWSNSGGLFPNFFSGCNGLCLLHVPGAGFEIDCSAPNSAAINYGPALLSAVGVAGSGNATNQSLADAVYDYSLFNITFDAVYNDGSYSDNEGLNYSRIMMNVLYTSAQGSENDGDANCPGTRVSQTCQLRPAVINYPVTIQDYTGPHSLNGISLGLNTSSTLDYTKETTPKSYDRGAKQQEGFEILRYNDVYEAHRGAGDPTESHLGGLVLGLQMYLAGSADLSFDGTVGFRIQQTGLAPTQLTNSPGAFNCGFQYGNPMDELVHKINQIMFLVATDIYGQNIDQTSGRNHDAVVYRDNIHYVTNIKFMWGAFASLLVCVLCVLPTYYGYWQLGRKVTLGPFEIANAFRAPMLEHPVASNGVVEDLLKEVGGRRVKYGEIITGDANGRLAIADPQAVKRVHPKIGSPHAKISEKIGSMFGKSHT
ncbi:hypothetical protein LTR28_010668 [Elasticomyces elasticus]|nr:hypothetical protein LTR28_010668 [Elasticomyces elasticus]